MKKAIILKMEGEGWNEPWKGCVPELKEKKRIVWEISWGYMDTDTRWAKGRTWWGKKIYTSLDSSLPTQRNAISTPE